MRKPAFKNYVRELVRIHDPAILIVMETQVGGDRAKEITNDLPFDGAIHTDTIGYAGGLWLLWNEDRVEVSKLANTEQEIHVIVKVHSSNLNWLLSAIYASPRCAERQVLWGNLKMMAEVHDLPWVMAGDFNEPLMERDKLTKIRVPCLVGYIILYSLETWMIYIYIYIYLYIGQNFLNSIIFGKILVK